MTIDLVSHWLHFFSANIQGKTSHKSQDGETNYLMRLYYEDKRVLTTVCAVEQLFYCSLIFQYYEEQPILYWLSFPSAIGVVFKNLINLLQISGACRVMVSIDRAHLYHAH